MKTTGKVIGIVSNLVTVQVNGPVAENELCHITLAGIPLLAEVIKVNGDKASVQVFESTRGLKNGDPVEFEGRMLEVTLGPGLLSSVYDGLQNNLATMEDVFLKRGEYTDPLDHKKLWEFTPICEEGGKVVAGDWLGEVKEGWLPHKIMVPFSFKGEYTVKKIIPAGSYDIDMVIAVLTDEAGETKYVTMTQKWPVKVAVKAYKEKPRPRKIMETGVRCIDTFNPIAEGGTGFGHMESCARSHSLYGPYEACPFNPILGERNPDNYIRRGGHGKPVQLPDGRWAFVYLCGRRVEGKTLMGRETAIDPLEWTPDGWPVVNHLKGPSCLQKKLLADAPVQASEPWICPRLSPESFSSPEAEEGVSLQGGAELSDLNGAHLLLHRLREAKVTMEAEVDLRMMATGGIAGLTGYYDERSYFLLGLRKTAQGIEAVLKQRNGDVETEETLGQASGWQAGLRVDGEGLTFIASCPRMGVFRQFQAEYLTDEGLKQGKRFTGALTGLAAVGSGRAAFRKIREEMRDAQD